MVQKGRQSSRAEIKCSVLKLCMSYPQIYLEDDDQDILVELSELVMAEVEKDDIPTGYRSVGDRIVCIQ